MDRPQNFPDRLSRTTSAAIRAIGQRRDAAVTFEGEGVPGKTVLQLKCPFPGFSSRDLAELRGHADSFALRLRYHDAKLHRRLRPADREAGELFDSLEQIRFEALGARIMRGVAANLAAAAPPPPHPVAELARARLMSLTDDSGAVLPPTVALPRRIGEALTRLADVLDDQRTFARVSRRLIAAVGLDPTPAVADDEKEGDDFAAADPRRPNKKEEGAATAKSNKDMVRTSPKESQAGPEDSDAAGSGSANADLLPEGGGDDPGGMLKRPPRGAFPWDARPGGYAAYTTVFDRVVRAEGLCSPSELLALRRNLDRRLNEVQAAVGRYASRLARVILARAERAWEVDLDEGLLDTRRLARIAANPERPLAFKRSAGTPFRDTTVSLLIDNSGSMRGDPIETAAVSADILGSTLERCGVTFEILGFTTAAWKGGQCFARWQASGRPPSPGRLNEVLHIIYKAASDPWRRARRNLALMLSDNLLKENIDGEALLWAHNRLLARPEQRRILIVLSDGEPVDNATVSANSDDYLERHLRNVVDYIVRRSPVELFAIGIGHDVARYYPAAVSVASVHDLTIELLGKVADLLEPSPPAAGAMAGHPAAPIRSDSHAPSRPAHVGEERLATLEDFAHLPVILGDGARYGPHTGEHNPYALSRG
jgi:cobaltochelatase CobT